MLKSAFEVLAIQPTNDFKTAKKAYIRKSLELHPDRYTDPQTKLEKNQQFIELATAWASIDTPEKLQRHFIHFGSEINSAAFIHEQPNQSASTVPAEVTDFPECINRQRPGFINIFIPVSIYNPEQEAGHRDSPKFPLTPINNTDINQFRNGFNFNQLAEILSTINNEEQFQIGMTREEAIEIVNQHSHYAY